MHYLLDTSTCIAAMQNHPLVVQKMTAQSPEECAISTITGYELYTGVAKCASPGKERWKVDRLLAVVSELPFDADAAREAARIRAALEAQGNMIGPYDVLLAGHALAAGLTLVTDNSAELTRVPGLRVENWKDTSAVLRQRKLWDSQRGPISWARPAGSGSLTARIHLGLEWDGTDLCGRVGGHEHRQRLIGLSIGELDHIGAADRAAGQDPADGVQA